MRVLCVDDNDEICRLFEMMIRDDPEFESAGTLADTDHLEEALRELKPGLVVMDLSMPGRDSLDVLRHVHDEFPDIRFLVSSAHDDPTKVERALEAGATGYVVKDGEIDTLLEAMRSVASGKRVVPGGSRWSSHGSSTRREDPR